MERNKQTARKSRMKELYAVSYMMHEEAHLTLKEMKKKKKMRRKGGRTVLAPPRMRRLFSQ